jgi:L-cysteate sulfo-lyase
MNIGKLPRVKLTHLPTPVEHLPNLSKKLGGPDIYIKRDDMTGLATGGNKSRMLEFLIGDAIDMGSDVIVTGANPLSNHVRQTTAAAKKMGLDVVIATSGMIPEEINGNLLLTKLLGAEIRFVGGDEYGLDLKMETIAKDMEESGQRPYVIHKFCSVPKGCVGYVNAFMELDKQLKQMEIGIDEMVVSSAAGTYSGIFVGTKALNSDIGLTGIAISGKSDGWEERLADLINGTAAHIGLDYLCTPQDINVNLDYFGEGYAAPTEDMVEAIKLAARTDGVLLDPVYTGKGMSGLIDLVRKDIYKKGEKVLFWHTGGVPSLFTPQYRRLFL